MPPTPIPAMSSFSLGGVYPAPPRRWRGTTVTEAAPAARPPQFASAPDGTVSPSTGDGVPPHRNAAASGAAPFSFESAAPQADASATSHALSPAAVLQAFLRVTDEPLPPAFVLAVRGYEFELGAPMSAAAARNLDAALEMLVSRFTA